MAALLGTAAAGLGIGLAKTVLGGLAAATGSQAGSQAGAARAPSPAEAKIKKTAQDFETMFLESMMDKMVQGLGEEGPLGENGSGGGVYRSMLAREYAASIVKSGGIGLSGQIQQELMRLQEMK